MNAKHGLLVALLIVLALSPAASPAQAPPVARAAATCDDYPNQAAAQRAADTRDADGDGIYCEDLPCPCSTEAGGGDQPPSDAPPADELDPDGCTTPTGVQRLEFSARKYPHIRAHVRAAIRKGWPRILVLNRPGADARRDRLMEDYPPRAHRDRDEYPPAVGRGKGKGLERGSNPRGWRADVRYVPSSENRSHGASLGNQLSDLCSGTRFRYVFTSG